MTPLSQLYRSVGSWLEKVFRIWLVLELTNWSGPLDETILIEAPCNRMTCLKRKIPFCSKVHILKPFTINNIHSVQSIFMYLQKNRPINILLFFCMSLGYFTVWNTGRYALCTSILENMTSPFINIKHFEFINKVWGYYQRMKYSKHDLKISTVPEPSKQHCISAMITQCQRRSTQSNTDFLSCKCP